MTASKRYFVGLLLLVGIMNLLFYQKCFAKPSMFPQQHRIVGKVTDSQSGDPLIGVNILDKGTTNGTTTDSHGNYVLKVKSLRDTLVFSYIGYKTKKVPISGRTEINVTMQRKVEAMQKLTVVAYGKQKR